MLAEAVDHARVLLELIHDHRVVDCRPLQGFRDNWEDVTLIDADRVRMATMALMHFDGDMADMVRWVGGSHVGAHRNVALLKGKVDDATVGHLERIWRHGVPNTCNVEATEENFQAFFACSNHSTLMENPEVAYRTLLKDDKRGYCLVFDPRIAPFILNAHFTQKWSGKPQPPDQRGTANLRQYVSAQPIMLRY